MHLISTHSAVAPPPPPPCHAAPSLTVWGPGGAAEERVDSLVSKQGVAGWLGTLAGGPRPRHGPLAEGLRAVQVARGVASWQQVLAHFGLAAAGRRLEGIHPASVRRAGVRGRGDKELA